MTRVKHRHIAANLRRRRAGNARLANGESVLSKRAGWRMPAASGTRFGGHQGGPGNVAGPEAVDTATIGVYDNHVGAAKAGGGGGSDIASAASRGGNR